MKIGIFSERHDPQAERLHHQINQLAPGSCRHFALPKDDGSPAVALDETGVYWDDVNVAELDIAYLHGFSYTYPLAPDALGHIDWSVWQIDHLLEQQKSSFLLSAFTEMERHGVKLLNPAKVYLKNFAKAELLEGLRQAGFPVPRMVCTNDMETTQTFIQEVDGKVVWRPATGRAAWQLFRDKQREYLISTEKPPILLAEIIEGPLIRSYLIDGEPLLCLNRYPPAYILHAETLESFKAIECPEVYGELQRLAAHLSLHWGQISFVLREGCPWIYDVDVDPILGPMPDVFQERLIDGLARACLGIGQASEPLPDTPQARRTLFLRRMLFPLFEFEHMKYSNQQ
ncbi:MAG TPA: hypothetical protein VLU73_15020 [Methylococcaceae bacterium]|jgi:hypothetical protein|nr:hypothetical protein [Methylococcaceae bacterium]